MTGSDRRRGVIHTRLDGATCVVVSSAIPEDDPEVLLARSTGLPIIHRAQALAKELHDRVSVAVSGTHGKTSTSAMLSHILTEAGHDPSYVLGGRIVGGANARYGTGPIVVEADESDRSLLLLSPQIAVITSIDDDHPETLNGLGDTLALFEDFTRRIPTTGTVVVCTDDPGGALLADRICRNLGPRVVTYGSTLHDNVTIRHLRLRPGNSHTTALIGGQQIEIHLALPGRHMALNAVAAAATAHLLGVQPEEAAVALASYRGVDRRLTLHGNHRGVPVVDSFAHHPTAITADLNALDSVTDPRGRIWVAFEPSGAARVERFGPQMGRALSAAAGVMLLPVNSQFTVPAADLLDPIRQELTNRRVPVWDATGDPMAAARLLASRAERGDVLVTMGAGTVTKLGPLLCAELDQPALVR
ncbi:UDP-N-acetylmuramate--alanine ligase [Actinomadura namibiensis]|uniref:UDP-N-acetylmuramate--alanine ligase n=1 Tax=Actinomadura namibiensis TaxID=182080 RepID=A0A7W3LYG0_ACTNM|nr:UDP-N-acetylmuramate--alanine ligase [Actinomadura namibiensis]